MTHKHGFFTGFTPGAHRGASLQFPENTMEAFQRALELLPHCMLETDVRRTRDGAIITMHDGLLQKKTNGSGLVHSNTFSEIRKLDAGYGITFDGGITYPFRGKGYRIPLFKDVLAAFPGANLSVDIKDNDIDAARDVISIMTEMNARSRVIVGSFHCGVMRFIRKKHPEILTSMSKGDIIRFIVTCRLTFIGQAQAAGDAMLLPEFTGSNKPEFLGKGVWQGMRIISPRLIQDAHHMGMPVLAWTINRPENMKRLIEWGVDGIITDAPDRLKEVMIDCGLPVR